MGVVYRAWEEGAQREVALKVLSTTSPSDTALERFRREGQALARLQDPRVLKVFSAGVIEDLPYLACELLEGARPLDEAWAGLEIRARAELLLQAAEGVAHAQSQGVIHRDLKPENVLVDGEGSLRVTDFGLAQVTDLERLTRSGALLGTPLYMSPEQLTGKRVDARADVWGLGVLLYEALCDERPFEAESLLALTRAVLSEARPPSALREGVPPALEALCLRALSADQERRPADAAAFARELRDCLSGAAPAPAPRQGPWVALGLVTTLALPLALAVWLAGPAAAPEPTPGPSATPPQRAGFLLLEPLPEVTWEDQVLVRGRLVRDAAAPLAPAPSGTPREIRVRLASDGTFARRVSLKPGRNRLTLRAEGVRGHLSVERRVPPTWFQNLPRSVRPPLPLPKGVEFGSGAEEYLLLRDQSVLVWVPPGHFTQGESEAFGPTGPAHTVTLSRGYFIGKHEVTWRQFRRHAHAWRIKAPEPAHPVSDDDAVHNVSWGRALEYCAWAGGRLPSEAEWERAARGTEPRPYPWGEAAPTAERAHFTPVSGLPGDGHRNSKLRARSAFLGEAGASPVGCLNMAGNVWEWVDDWWGPYKEGPLRDPPGPTVQEAMRARNSRRPLKVIRGGSCRVGALMIRAAHRDGFPGSTRQRDLGFRICLVPQERLELTWKVRWCDASATVAAVGTAAAAQRWSEDRARATAEVETAGLRLYYEDAGPSGHALGKGVSGAPGGKAFGTLAECEVELRPGTYEIGGISDDALRVWIDGQLLIDHWKPHLPTLRRQQLRIKAPKRVRLRVEHLQRENYACLEVWLARLP
jgi:formylglycine-generating enzyme required for sulfatase activity